MSARHTLVTGGAGFVGSHLAERLLAAGETVSVVDDLSTGRRDWVPEDATFLEGGLTEDTIVDDVVSEGVDRIAHLASRKRVDDPEPRAQFRENTDMTYAIVEAAIEADVEDLLFTSTSTVYGEAPRPTPEDHSPLEPISAYGASKLACEAILSTAPHNHDIKVYNVRFANIVGPRLRGNVIADFIEKLRASPERLEILGDGRQEKSYMHIEDCLDAMQTVVESADGPMATYNLGTRTTTSVREIADIVAEEMDLSPTYEYTGGKRGWTGDVPRMQLSIEKLTELGWEPNLESTPAVRRATRELLEEL